MKESGEAQQAPPQRKLNKNAYFVVLSLYIMVPFLAGGWYYLQTVPFISCSKHQKLVRRVSNFMPPAEFERIQTCLKEHPLTGESVLSQNAFAATKGFVIAFNRDGVQDFKEDNRFDCLHSYFDRAAIHDANAFVMNLLVCHLPTNLSDVVVGLHVDNTLKSYFPAQFYAHQVNVLYMSTPPDMQGGTLEVWRYDDGVQPDQHNPRAPDATVVPEDNVMIAFRGDSWHRVRGYETETSEKRISLVLEQYKVPEVTYPFTQRFAFVQREGMDPM